jgi:hypothetical protein
VKLVKLSANVKFQFRYGNLSSGPKQRSGARAQTENSQ